MYVCPWYFGFCPFFQEQNDAVYPVFFSELTPEQTPEQQLVPDIFNILPDPSAFFELNPEGIPDYILDGLFPELLDPQFYFPQPQLRIDYFW